MNVTVKMAVAAAAIMVSGNAFADELILERTLNVTAPIESCTLDTTNGALEKTVEEGSNMVDDSFGAGQVEIIFSGVTLECDENVSIDSISYERTLSQSMIDAGVTADVRLNGDVLAASDDVTTILPLDQQVPFNTRFFADGFATFAGNVIPEGQYVQTNTFTIVYQQ